MEDAARGPDAVARQDAQGVAHEQDLIAHLQVAVRTRQLVGQATGILIATYRISPEQAWEMLSGASQHTNIKVVRLAAAVVQAASGSTVVDDLACDAVSRYLLPIHRRARARAQPRSGIDQLSSADRLTLAAVRDELAQQRDAAADLADQQAAERDAAAVAREHAEPDAANAQAAAAQDRAAAAQDRAKAHADRRAAAVERALAAEDRAAPAIPAVTEAAENHPL